MEQQYNLLSEKKKELSKTFVEQEKNGSASAVTVNELRNVNAESEKIRTGLKDVLKKEVGGDASDTNYIFIRFVVDYLPKGLVGLLIAVIFLASWGSIAAALNSLASSTVVDIHKKFINTSCTEFKDYSISRYYSLAWGIFCIIIAQFANNMGSLIEAVNVLGSLFYGVILGIFLVAFYCKNVKGNAVFSSALIVEVAIILLFWKSNIGFLWLNLIGALGVVAVALIMHATFDLLKLSKQ